MNLEKLIEAAWEIDSLAKEQERRTQEWTDLARDARNPKMTMREIEARRQQLDMKKTIVIDYSTAIEKIRAALHSQ